MRSLFFYTLIVLFGSFPMLSRCSETKLQTNYTTQDSTKIYPSDIIPELYKWKIQMPVDSLGKGSEDDTSYLERNTNPLHIAGNKLINYEYPPYFEVIDSEVIFHAPCWGATTHGSNYPRSELRELVNGGDNYWSVNDYQFLEAELQITHLPDEKPGVCFTQIHAPGHYEPLRLHFNAKKGLYIVYNTTHHYYIKDEVPYSLGQTLLVKVTVQYGTITCFIKNLANGKQTDRSWKSEKSTGYFKIGCYTQSSIFLSQFKDGYQDEPMSAYGEVRVLKLSLDKDFYNVSQTTRQYASNQMAALIHDLRHAQSGDVFQLTSPGGIYVVDSAYLPVTTNITIEALPGLAKKPIIKLVQGGLSSQVDYLIRFTARDVSLTLKGIELQGDATASKYAIRTAKIGDFGVYSGYKDPSYDKQPVETYNLTIDSCNFHGFTEGAYGYAINFYPGTLGNNVIIKNSTFSQIKRNAIEAYTNTSEINAHGYWQFVDYLNINNCTFYNIGRAAMEIKSTDTSAVSGQNYVVINHATFDSCAWDNSSANKYHTLMVDYVHAKISNCIFSDDVSDDYIFKLTNPASEVSNIGVWNFDGTAMSDTIHSKGSVANIYFGNPGYQDRAAGNFMLSSDSPFLGKATDGHALGDLRWESDYSLDIQQITADNKELVIYASGSNVYIKFKNNNSLSGTVILENISGQIVYRNVLNGTHQQVLHTHLSPGIYIVVAKMKSGLIMDKKIIIS